MRLLLEIAVKTEDEPRFLAIGKIEEKIEGQTGKKHWSAVITYRGSSVRLISVRRARIEEVALYES